MSAEPELQQKEAEHGQKMIEVKVRFWTDEIADAGHVLPKHAWAAGVVRLKRNELHEIVPDPPTPFNSLPELASVIEQVLIDHGIRLHPSRRMQKYMVAGE